MFISASLREKHTEFMKCCYSIKSTSSHHFTRKQTHNLIMTVYPTSTSASHLLLFFNFTPIVVELCTEIVSLAGVKPVVFTGVSTKFGVLTKTLADRERDITKK